MTCHAVTHENCSRDVGILVTALQQRVDTFVYHSYQTLLQPKEDSNFTGKVGNNSKSNGLLGMRLSIYQKNKI